MSRVAAFLSQPCRPYRDFQIVFTLITLNFAVPAASYVVAPHLVVEQLSVFNQLLGGGPYPYAEAELGSRLWRFLGAANVMTLAVMCLVLQLDLRKSFSVLLPLAFLKGYNAFLFLVGFFQDSGAAQPILLAVAALDFGTCALFVFFARRAHRAIAAVADRDLVPPPRSFRAGQA